jgi:predicted nuclease of predicted toxin-antitoxin system
MKLLFDENLSAQLPKLLAAEFPDSIHVRDRSLRQSSDRSILKYAASNGFVVVTEDLDFQFLSALQGFPPKAVLMRTGNCPTAHVAHVLRMARQFLLSFEKDPLVGVVILP